MDYTKQWWQSKGVWGGIAAVVVSLLQASGIAIEVTDGGLSAIQLHIVDAGIAFAGFVAGIVAVIGRLTATKAIVRG